MIFNRASSRKLSSTSRRHTASRRFSDSRRRLGVEGLENRHMLTTFTVLNTDDSGAGSLRQAILNVNADTGSASDVIAFDIGGGGVQTITPLSPLPRSPTRSRSTAGASRAGLATRSSSSTEARLGTHTRGSVEEAREPLGSSSAVAIPSCGA